MSNQSPTPAPDPATPTDDGNGTPSDQERTLITDNAAALVIGPGATELNIKHHDLSKRYGATFYQGHIQAEFEASIEPAVRRYRPQWEVVGNKIYGPANSQPLTEEECRILSNDLYDQIEQSVLNHLDFIDDHVDARSYPLLTYPEFRVITEDLGLDTPTLAKLLDLSQASVRGMLDQSDDINDELDGETQEQILSLDTTADQCVSALQRQLHLTPYPTLDDAAAALAEIGSLKMPRSWHIGVLNRMRPHIPAPGLEPALNIEVRAHGLGLTLDQLAGQIRCHTGPTDAQWMADLSVSLLPYSDAIDALQRRHDDYTEALVAMLFYDQAPNGNGERILFTYNDVTQSTEPDHRWNAPLAPLPRRWYRAAAARARRQVELLRLRYFDPTNPLHLTIMKRYPHI